MYIVHDRLTDTYHGYKHLTGVAKHEGLSINTLGNKFTREKKRTYTTPDAKVITKTELL